MFRDFFFFQHLVLNHPHSATQQLYHAEHQRLPDTIKFFAGAYTLMNEFWNNPANIKSYLTQHGHKSWFIQTVIARIASLRDYFKLWQRHVIQSLHVDLSILPVDERIDDKKNGVVNGQRAVVKLVKNETVFLNLPNRLVVATHLVTCKKADGTLLTTYPFVPAYSVTICKSQGQTLQEVVLWMDAKVVPAGAAYVRLSRVKRLENLYFLTPTTKSQYRPVTSEIATATAAVSPA